ncbi:MULTISPECIES: hypothetical protein [unclassified Streptomyces]|uniref:hypothetical protein n=1 Tax=unclassified Streptomyces TaxID=2593676 RepID=UPI002DD9B394|nr:MULTISPECIES: hypothetical protein [unclassified Streptomyces]WSA97720.1 hypothetical protein OIE63_40210 [Streptomyces sp. NBC_01795]WSB82028.1 hypothetical protein OHB04_40600 [Streptomyces sp. NBC_01775]WSS46761.1 hypothetical protein OG220_40000 [Streptomyces sp. NBC_01187]WSS47022.1 hypothetical protein OG220_41625 [Streptomyces sp. NBC_01187]
MMMVAPSSAVVSTVILSGRGTRPRTSKKDGQPSYCSSISSQAAVMRGLRSTIGLAPGFGGPYGRGCAADADLWGRESHALAGEVVCLGDAVRRLGQLVEGVRRGVLLGGQVEGGGGLGEEAGVVLDDAEVPHAPAGPHLAHCNFPARADRHAAWAAVFAAAFRMALRGRGFGPHDHALAFDVETGQRKAHPDPALPQLTLPSQRHEPSELDSVHIAYRYYR